MPDAVLKTNKFGQDLTLPGGQVISAQDPNYTTYAGQAGLAAPAATTTPTAASTADSTKGIASGAGDSRQFGLALMDLLKGYQGVEKQPFMTQGYNAQEEQNRRVAAPTSSDLIGASPGMQSAVRSASASAVQPTISGAATAGQTFSSQLSTFKDTLSQAREIQQAMDTAQNSARDDARTVIKDGLTIAGGSAFDGMDEKELGNLEKLAGYPKGYLLGIKKTLKEIEIENKKKGSSSGSGDLGSVDFGVTPTAPTPEAPKQTFDQFLAGEEQKAGQSFSMVKRNELKRQFEANQSSMGDVTGAAPTDKKQKWVDNPKVDARIKGIILGQGTFFGLTQTERKQLQTQYNQALQDGVVPHATNVVDDKKFDSLASEYEHNKIVQNRDNAAGLSTLADQIISNPGNSTNQLKALYGLIKNLDPNSAVREGEINLAQSTLSVFDRIGNRIAKLTGRQVIPPDLAVEYANAIKELGQAWGSALTQIDKRYSARAATNQIGPMWEDYKKASGASSNATSGKTSSGIGYKIIQ